jgi:hypothetical protein
MEFIRSYDSISFGLPTNRGGSAPALSVSGPAQRSLTLRPARSPSRLATLCTRGFSSLVASTAALIATGWSEPVPGRVTPAVDHRLFTTHPVTRLHVQVTAAKRGEHNFRILVVLRAYRQCEVRLYICGVMEPNRQVLFQLSNRSRVKC